MSSPGTDSGLNASHASLLPENSSAAPASSREKQWSPSDLSSPATPAQAAKDVKSGSELLRRLSLRGTPAVLEAHPREQYPSLNLSGRIISAAFCIPYKLYLRKGHDWVRCSFLPSTASANQTFV